MNTLPASLQSLALTRSSLALAGLIVLLAWETFAPGFAFPGARERGLHGLRNLVLGALNSLLIAVGFVAFWFAATGWAQAHRFGLLWWLALPPGPRVALAFLLFDAWMYWWHRLNHRLPFLWRFHRTHHSDSAMDVTTASRFHLGEIFFSSCLRVAVILLLGLRLEELFLYETAMFAVVQFHHANIRLPQKLDDLLRTLIVTPDMHKVHHSRTPIETDSNYSSLFSFWDRLFRTSKRRADPGTIRFGLEGFDGAGRQTLAGLMKTPLEEQETGGK